MALIFIDGFDHYDSTVIDKKWSYNNNGWQISAAAGRRGGGALYSSGGNHQMIKYFPPFSNDSLVMGFAMKKATNGGVTELVKFGDDAGKTQASIRTNASNGFGFYRGGDLESPVLLASSSNNVMSNNGWYYLEIKVQIANSISADSCILRVNGTDVINLSAGTDTQSQTASTLSRISLFSISAGAIYIDDLYVCDTTGSTNKDFLGDCRIDTLFPNNDGAYTNGTPSTGSTHYTLVDESVPNTSDYVSLSNVGDKDSYAFTDLPSVSSNTIYGVQVNSYWQKSDSGARSAAALAKSGSTVLDGSSVVLSSGYTFSTQVYETDPDTSAAWTKNGVNSAEFGVKVTA